MQRIYEDINTMNSIVRAMETTQTMGTVVSRSDVLTEVDLVRTRIKNSCKRLMDLMTDEEMTRLDVAPVIKMFGENIKPDIVKLLRR
jgi:predicted transcriptional regulator